MKQTRKIFVALLVLMTILMSLVVVAIPASAASGTVTVSKNHKELTALAGVSTSTTGGSVDNKQIKMDDYITVIPAKGKAANPPAYYNESIRFYQNGATLTVKCADGAQMTEIVITIANNSAGDGPIAVTGGTASALTSLKYTITVNSGASEVVITTKGTDKNSRLYVANLEVSYDILGNAECNHSNTVTETVPPTCTEAGEVIVKCADESCGYVISATEGEPATGHTYEDRVCVDCGTLNPVMTIAQALAAADDTKVIVTGQVVSIDTAYSSTYKNITVTISDGTGKLQSYRLDGGSDLKKHSNITITGTMDTYSGKRQIAQGATYVLNGTNDCEYKSVVTPPSVGAQGYTTYTCTVCGKSYKDNYVSPILGGSGTEDDPYVINNAEELELFRASVNAGETKYNAPGVWVALGADIDLAGTTWTEGIGDGHSYSFDGNFDGKNFKIKNLTITPYADSENPETAYICGGLFGYVYGNVTIKNLVLENVSVSTTEAGHNVGALVGFAYGSQITIDNITVQGDVMIDTPNAYGTGAILGYSYYTKVDISNSKVVANEGSSITGYSYVGGITGYSANNATFTNCSVSGLNITGTSYSVGGIAGLVLSGNTFSGCEVDATVSGQANVGSIVGAIGSQGTSINIENCTAQGSPVGGYYGDNKPVVAVIDNKYYSSLADAFAAGGEVTLLANVELDAPIVIDGSVTLNLAGYTLSYATDVWNENMITINDKGSLVINDSSSLTRSGSATGAISFVFTGAADTSYGKGNYAIVNNGSLTLNSGSIKIAAEGVEGTFSHALYAIQNAGDLTINGGSVVNNNNTAIRNWNDANITVNGGEISGTRAIWVQLPSGASAAAPEINIAINGGTLTATEQTYNLAIYVYSYGQSAEKLALAINDGVINGNVALYVNDATLDDNAVKVTGGEINGEYGVFSYGTDDALAANKIAITGGEFKTDYSAKYAEDDGFIFVKNAEGTYSTLKGSLATPSIQEVDGVKYWFIGTVNTGVKAEGIDGQPGQDGVTPSFQIANGYIQVSYDNGTTWENLVALDEIKGEDGKDGVDGEDGKDGVDGEDGKDGVDGEDGKDGVDGEDGKDGADGEKGDKGDKGDQGIQGEKGDKGDQGEQGIQGEKGDNADATKEVRIAIAIATVAIIFALAVLLFWRVKRRSWWCYR